MAKKTRKTTKVRAKRKAARPAKRTAVSRGRTTKTAAPRKTADGRGAKPKRRLKEPRVPRHEAVWLDGPVPHGYWQYDDNRVRYMRWLGQRLGFRTMEDWYKVTTEEFKRNRGSGALLHCWNSSAIVGVKECFPFVDWKEWLFVCCPRAFWKDKKNHQRYMKWLAEQCGVRKPDDWYQITNQHFRDHKGGAFLTHYRSTVSAAIKTYVPNHDWKEWMFGKTPKGFWGKRKNRQRYMNWLGERLGYKNREDWYQLTRKEFDANFGNQFIKRFDGSPISAVKDYLPRVKWNEWMFARVPFGYWNQRANRQRYIKWLGKRLKYRKPKDWAKIRREDIKNNYGGGLLTLFHSYVDLLKDTMPRQDWDAILSSKG